MNENLAIEILLELEARREDKSLVIIDLDNKGHFPNLEERIEQERKKIDERQELLGALVPVARGRRRAHRGEGLLAMMTRLGARTSPEAA